MAVILVRCVWLQTWLQDYINLSEIRLDAVLNRCLECSLKGSSTLIAEFPLQVVDQFSRNVC